MSFERSTGLTASSLSLLTAVLAPCSSLADEQAKLTAWDGAAQDRFGSSVSVSGDTLVVGAWEDDDNGFNSGSAYVFVRGGTVWSRQAKLVASDAAADDQSGISVSVSGDTAVVGAWLDDDNGGSSGSAYVFAPSPVRNPGPSMVGVRSTS